MWLPDYTKDFTNMFSSLAARRRQEGFSLIELLVVILIIGILATVAIPRFLGQRDSANDTKAKNAVRVAMTNAETWYAQRQSYENLTTANFATLETAVTLDDTALGSIPATSLTTNINPNTVFTMGTIAASGTQDDDVTLCAVSKSTKTFCARMRSNAATTYYASPKAQAWATTDTAAAASTNTQGW